MLAKVLAVKEVLAAIWRRVWGLMPIEKVALVVFRGLMAAPISVPGISTWNAKWSAAQRI